jgi:hypothetical protein
MKVIASGLALLLCVLAGISAAQNVAPIRPMERVATPPVERVAAPTQQEISVDERVVDPQGMIDRLEAQNRELRAANEALRADVAERQARIEAMIHPGGSAVMAYCENDYESRNTAGAADACGAYTCNPTSGLCRDRCTTSLHCGPGTACDIVSGTCQAPPTGD